MWRKKCNSVAWQGQKNTTYDIPSNCSQTLGNNGQKQKILLSLRKKRTPKITISETRLRKNTERLEPNSHHTFQGTQMAVSQETSLKFENFRWNLNIKNKPLSENIKTDINKKN